MRSETWSSKSKLSRAHSGESRAEGSGGSAPSVPCAGPRMVPGSGRTRGVGLPRRNNSRGCCGETWYFRAGRFVSCRRTAIPHLHYAPVGGSPWPPANQGSAGSRPNSPRPPGQRVAPGGAPHRPQRKGPTGGWVTRGRWGCQVTGPGGHRRERGAEGAVAPLLALRDIEHPTAVRRLRISN